MSENALKRDEKGRLVKGTPPGPGRTEGILNFNTMFEQAVKRVATERNMNIGDVEIIAVAIKKIMQGDFKFYKDTMDRRFGSANKGTEVNIDNRKVEVSWIQKCPHCGKDI